MFNSDDEIYQSINKLLIEQFGFPKKLSYETKINELAGDDAIEFIEEFSKKLWVYKGQLCYGFRQRAWVFIIIA